MIKGAELQFRGVFLGLLCGLVCAQSFSADRVSSIDRYMQSMAELLAPSQREALQKINDRSRRDLAMVYYLRAGPSIENRWSWTDEQIVAYEQSPEYAAALDEINKISAHFAAENPNRQLHVNTAVRSLETQLHRWQVVRSIGVSAAELRTAALQELQTNYPGDPDSDSLQRYREFLVAWRASYPPTLAAPGLSLHGRGGAFDFQIHDHRGRVLATIDSSTSRRIWHEQGWSKKLALSIAASSTRFFGPLAMPDEPWHYEYRSDN